jgi:hypothetical protein
VNAFSSYRMEEVPREEMAAADPFGGRGVFLSAPGMSSDEIIKALAERTGKIIPAAAWDCIGAWVDPGSTGMSSAHVRDLWDGGKAGEHG